MKNFIVLILLAGVLTMNTSMFCQSLCMADGGHKAKSHGHASDHGKHEQQGHQMPEGAMCPADHADHCTHHNTSETSLKCNCSAGDDSSSAYETALIKPIADFVHYIHIVPLMDTTLQSYSSMEPVPLTGPPNILS